MSAEGDRRKLLVLASSVVFFFGIHNFLQEAIINRPGFHFGWALGLLEMLGTCIFSAIERYMSPPNGTPTSSNSGTNVLITKIDYVIVAVCLMASSSLSNIALNYINFPTKVVFRSCKLIPTMLIAVLIHRRSFDVQEWLAAAAVCLGLVLVGVADATTEGATFSPWGLTLVSLSVLADAVMPNVQQRLFARGESRADVVFYTNLLVSGWMAVSLWLSGDLAGAVGVAAQDTACLVMMVTYACVAYVAVSCHMAVVQRFGGVTAVLVGNARKVVTVAVSFLAFPKPVSLVYVAGVALSLGGLTVAMLRSEKNRSLAKRPLPRSSAQDSTSPLISPSPPSSSLLPSSSPPASSPASVSPRAGACKGNGGFGAPKSGGGRSEVGERNGGSVSSLGSSNNSMPVWSMSTTTVPC